MTPPETIWTEPPDIFDGMGLWHDKPRSRLTEYRRADLPPTLAQALELPEIAALVDAAENVVIACGMGWDLGGFHNTLRLALEKVEP